MDMRKRRIAAGLLAGVLVIGGQQGMGCYHTL